jgi:hypothetical protein
VFHPPLAKFRVQVLQLLFGKVFAVAIALSAPFIAMISSGQFDLPGEGVAVLTLLDQEHHQEGDNGRAGVNGELPSVAETENRTGRRPCEHDTGRGKEGNRRPMATAARRAKRSKPATPVYDLVSPFDPEIRPASLGFNAIVMVTPD